MTIRTTLAAATAAIATLTIGMLPMAAHAQAAPAEHVAINTDGAPTFRVHYEDLDLSSADGRHAMETRIGKAATRVCAPLREASIDGAKSTEYNNCRSDAIAQAQAEVDAVINGAAR